MTIQHAIESRKRDEKGKYVPTVEGGWKSKVIEYQKRYRETHPWAAHRMWAKSRSKTKKREFSLTTSQVKELWDRDSAHLLQRPSLDRIDGTKGYTVDNCRFIELSENSRLGNIGRDSTEKQREAGRKNLTRWANSQGL